MYTAVPKVGEGILLDPETDWDEIAHDLEDCSTKCKAFLSIQMFVIMWHFYQNVYLMSGWARGNFLMLASTVWFLYLTTQNMWLLIEY